MDLAFFPHFSLFSSLSEKEIKTLSKYFEHLTFKKGATIYTPGQVRDKLRLILKGRIEVSAQTYDFEEPTTIYGPGQFLGEAALLQEGTLHKAKSIAVTNVEMVILSRANFLKLMKEHQDISCKIQMNIGTFVFNKLSRGASHGNVHFSGYGSGKKRHEHDLLGDREISDEAYYGVQTLRAIENFNITAVVLRDFPVFIKGLAQVKKAAALANCEIGVLEKEISEHIVMACDEIIAGHWHDQFLVDMIQGGAGTSTNMNANEVIANRALELLGKQKGEYHFIHPNNHVNLGQSTNDAYPTAIRLAALQSIPALVEALEELCETLSEKGREFSDVIKMGRTQLQDAVPMTLGQEFEAFSVMLSEDIARIREGSKLFLEL
ncbi:lyase family protein, partial [Silvanigrella sp.]|uniref:lyase family protein n=1 Tax=Silvanigrella sp. TaxID=2024976 RepID=UPI0037CBFEE6